MPIIALELALTHFDAIGSFDPVIQCRPQLSTYFAKGVACGRNPQLRVVVGHGHVYRSTAAVSLSVPVALAYPLLRETWVSDVLS